mmetsp:Transcript_94535/g.282282  ORF Transcript_94535/g.282282 Transcript_94535/m.282282 type:complete len:206 (-) Transcript_94535:21-638(-)
MQNHAMFHQLAQVLVAAHDPAAVAGGDHPRGEGGQEVVGLIFLVVEARYAEGLRKRATALDLRRQLRWRQLAVRLVGRVELVPEAGRQATVPTQRHVRRRLVGQVPQQEVRESHDSVGCSARRVLDGRGQGIVGPEKVGQCIDEVHQGALHTPANPALGRRGGRLLQDANTRGRTHVAHATCWPLRHASGLGGHHRSLDHPEQGR